MLSPVRLDRFARISNSHHHRSSPYGLLQLVSGKAFRGQSRISHRVIDTGTFSCEEGAGRTGHTLQPAGKVVHEPTRGIDQTGQVYAENDRLS